MKKSYSAYEEFMAYYIIFGITLMYVLAIGLSIFSVVHFSYDGIGLAFIIDIIPFVVIPILSYKDKGIERFYLRCRFEEDGIHCFGLFWKPFVIRWDEIKTFGRVCSSYSYASADLMIFSTEKEYYPIKDKKLERTKKLMRINDKRMIIGYRDRIKMPLTEFMPKDMKKYFFDPQYGGKEFYIQR